MNGPILLYCITVLPISILSFLFGNVIRPFFGSYSAEKGKNLATKEDIAQITKVQEEIKAKISDDVWDRQKQWEMRRDAVFEVVRVLGEVDEALLNLSHTHALPIPDREGLKEKVLTQRKEARKHFDLCNTRFEGARFVTDMVLGNKLAAALADCINEIRVVSLNVLSGDTNAFRSSQEALAQMVKAVYVASRSELRIGNIE